MYRLAYLPPSAALIAKTPSKALIAKKLRKTGVPRVTRSMSPTCGLMIDTLVYCGVCIETGKHQFFRLVDFDVTHEDPMFITYLDEEGVSKGIHVVSMWDKTTTNFLFSDDDKGVAALLDRPKSLQGLVTEQTQGAREVTVLAKFNRLACPGQPSRAGR